MTAPARAELLRVATRYIWWEKPEKAIRRPIRIIAQVMDIGDYDDVQRLIAALGLEPLREALTQADPGWFSERSWGYWCYRLGLTEPGAPPPPLPQRVFQ